VLQAKDGLRDDLVTGVQPCALPISVPVLALRRPGHRVLPRAPFDEGPELEQLERPRARRPAGGGAADARPEEAQGDLRPRPDPEIGRASCRERVSRWLGDEGGASSV